MSKFKFTPGPWGDFNDDSDMQPIAFVGTSSIDNKTYQIGQRHTQIHEGDAKHNAKLISCAPEMLEALIEIGKENTSYMDRHEKCRRLAEKASGLTWEEINGN